MIECRPAATINIGDRVLTKEGWFEQVEDVDRYAGDVTCIVTASECRFVDPYEITVVKH